MFIGGSNFPRPAKQPDPSPLQVKGPIAGPVPVGTVLPWAGGFYGLEVPKGWALCEGQVIDAKGYRLDGHTAPEDMDDIKGDYPDKKKEKTPWIIKV